MNNLGHSILLAFALISDETTESYKWVFRKLKQVWKKDPVNIITDDCEAMQNGKFLF